MSVHPLLLSSIQLALILQKVSRKFVHYSIDNILWYLHLHSPASLNASLLLSFAFFSALI